MLHKIKEIQKVVCESCVESVFEEGFDVEGLDEEEGSRVAADICRQLGKELIDHLCDEREGNIEAMCLCACNGRR